MPKISKLQKVSRSTLAQAILTLDGKPYSLKDYPHMLVPYNIDPDELVMHFSRQTSKSVTIAGRMLMDAVSEKFLKQMYVSPTMDQTKIFSNDRVKPFIEGSNFISKYFVDPRLAQNVFTKEFKNGSRLYMRYALHDAEKLRGNSIDKLYFDETQSLRSDVIDITSEVMNRSEYKKIVYGGTPLRSKGTLADIWHKSTMNEYAIKCGSCGFWNILDDKNIGKTGPICSKCGSYEIDLKKGQWVSSYSLSAKKPKREGFRVCALHFAGAPWVQWERDIIHKMENRPKQIFFNETLALEYDGGSVPITRQQLYQFSSTKRMNEKPDRMEVGYATFSGIDYGPESSDNSNTVLVNIQRRPGYYLVVYAKKFLGKEANFTYIHEEVPKIMSTWKSLFIAADYGMGEASNAEIRKRVGENKLIAFQHVNTQKEKMRYNNKMNAYTLNRTECMSLLFNAIKGGIVRFRSPLDMDIFFNDILNIYAEYDDELGTMRYINSGPDDFFHALLYVIFASDAYEGETMLTVN